MLEYIVLIIIHIHSTYGQCSVHSQSFENEFCTMKSQVEVLLADDTKVTAVQHELTTLRHSLQMETAKIVENQKRLTSLEQKSATPVTSSPDASSLHAEVMDVARQTNNRIHNLTSLIMVLQKRMDILEASCMACTEAKHPCSSNPCKNGGQCLEISGGYYCVCDLKYSGKNCEKTDNCIGMNCENGGTCVSNSAGSSCTCASGFTGPKCESKLDACSSNPCVNGLCFLDNNNTDFLCLCNDGYTGKTCAVASARARQTLVTHIITTPSTTTRSPRICANGNSCNDPAICIDQGPANYTCQCPPTNQTKTDICFEPYYFHDFDWCCIKNVCQNNSQPICN